MTTILMVEDDPEQATLYRQLLLLCGYQVETASDAEDAFSRLAERASDLVLVDWDLPGIKGDTFITQLRERYPAIRSILFSNHTHVDEAAGACGADVWYRKSDDIFRLREIISTLVGK